jgi:thymidine kinase
MDSLILLNQRGRIEMIMGPMFAGKSTELLRRIKRLEISGKKCISIKYSGDNRYSNECISTHD